LCCLAAFILVPVQMASAETQEEAIVAAARSMEGQGYPYCFDGGNTSGPTVGITDHESDGSYSNCASIGRVGFDCTGLTLYAVYQGTGNAGLSHDGYQARSGGGQRIGSVGALQPGDVVYFDYNAGNGLGHIDHAGIYVGGEQVLSAVSEKYGIRTESIAWYEAGGLHFVGGVRYWSGSAGSGGGIGEGSFVSNDGYAYRIAGGAPIYVSSWNAVGGPQATTPLSDAEFAALPQYPRDGTQLDSSDGGVFIVAGGAPMYVSNWAAIGGPHPGIGIDGAAIANAGGGVPWNHLRPYPADGTQLDASNGGVFIVAGGAPMYVSNWAAIGGPRPGVGIDGWDIEHPDNPAAHLRPYPADGTQLDSSTGGVYIVAGGAPMYVSNWAAIGGPHPGVGIDGWDIEHPDNPAAHLRPYPADGTFLNSSTGAVYRVAGGAAIPVTTWRLFGGVQPYTTIDQWDIENPSNPAAHLRPYPADGTMVEGLPSDTYWLFGGGFRSSSPASSGAVAVDDAGLAAFPVRSQSGSLTSSAPAGTHAPGGSRAAAGAASKKHKSCHKIKKPHKQARCAPAARHRNHHKEHGRARTRGTSATDRLLVGDSRLPIEGASAPDPTLLRWQMPDYRLCRPQGAEPLAWVADLHRVPRRTACRVARKIIEYPWPESGLHTFDQSCGNWLWNVHHFDGWNVKVPDHGLPRLSRGQAWFSFQGEDFPVGC
jgi:cell wall-associated NlpC family hydrolase